MELHLSKDIWSSGQMGSKLWLCENVETLFAAESQEKPFTIWILGGWVALTAQLFFVRQKLQLKTIRSFDIDPKCEPAARSLHDLWAYNSNLFKAYTADCNELDYSKPELWDSSAPDLVINTAAEHFESKNWFKNIPDGTRVLIQSNNMNHSDHVFNLNSAAELAEHFPVKETYFLDSLFFDYKNENSFNRYMLIGRK